MICWNCKLHFQKTHHSSVPPLYQPQKGHIPGRRPHTCPEQHFSEPIKILENAPVAETTGNAARSKMLEDNLATA
jgi:hypothetical protein